MILEFVFATADEARAFLQGIEYVNDGSCHPLDVVTHPDGLSAARIEDEDVEDEDDLTELPDDELLCPVCSSDDIVEYLPDDTTGVGYQCQRCQHVWEATA